MEWSVSSAYWFSFLWIYTAKELLDHKIVLLFLTFSAPIHYSYNNHNNEVCVLCMHVSVWYTCSFVCTQRPEQDAGCLPLILWLPWDKVSHWIRKLAILARAPRICLSLLPHNARLIDTCSHAWLFFGCWGFKLKSLPQTHLFHMIALTYTCTQYQGIR